MKAERVCPNCKKLITLWVDDYYGQSQRQYVEQCPECMELCEVRVRKVGDDELIVTVHHH